jgi:ATP-dependent helicase HepA
MLMLTATPLQTGNQDLFNLLRILAPGEFDNFDVFLSRLEPNRHINMAAQVLATGQHQSALRELHKVERTLQRGRFLNNLYYSELTRLLSSDYLRREQLVTAQRKLVELNTLAHVFTRTRKREIAEKVPTRAAFVLKVNFTPAEARFYRQVVEHVRTEFMRLHGTNYAIGWVSIMRERQTASCISAARQRFADLVEGARQDILEDGFYDPDIIGDMYTETGEVPSRKGKKVKPLGIQLPTSRDLERDSKFEIFWSTLSKVLAEDADSKIIVFSFFIATIEHLYRQLSKRGVGVLRIHGGFKVPDRQEIIDQFRDESEIRVLISSDVGAEGLDFQFSNTIFNYDLPWNPMRLEQRIGRIDRFGQEADRIRIYSLVIQDSIESRILMRLYERIGLFREAIGDIEAILGEEIRELTRCVYTRRLSPQEEEALADRAASNIVRRRQELEEFEKKRLQFMGQEAIFSTLVDQTIESGNYVSEAEIRHLVATFGHKAFKRSKLESNVPPDGTFCLSIGDDLAEYLRGYILTKKKADQTAQEFLRVLTHGKQLPITFEHEMASRRKLLHFITLRHPLTQAALDYWREKVNPAESFARIGLRPKDLQGGMLRPGEYYFFLFTFQATGVEKTSRLVPVVVVPHEGDVYTELSRRLLHLTQTSAYELSGRFPKIDLDDLESAKETALGYMATRRNKLEAEIRRNNEALVNARLQAISQSYEAKRRRIEQTMGKVREERILRLYRGQLRNQETRYQARTKEIEALRDVSVSYSLVLRGMVRVDQGTE